MTDDDDEVLHGELRDPLVDAMQRVPELAGRELILTFLSGGITNRNFLVTIPGESERYVIRLAGNDTHLLGISREVEHAATVAAAGVGVGPEVTAFIRPEGYLVTRFIEGSPVSFEQVRERATLARIADSLRRIHQGPAIPGLFVPLRIVEAYRALAMARGVPIPPEYELASGVGRRIELACLADPVELRPCHNDLLNANFIDDGTRIRIVDWEYAGMGDPYFDLGNFSINHELTPDDDAYLRNGLRGPRLRQTPGAPVADARRLRFPRGHVGRPPAGDQHPRCRLRRLRRRAFRSTAVEGIDAGVRACAARDRGQLTSASGQVAGLHDRPEAAEIATEASPEDSEEEGTERAHPATELHLPTPIDLCPAIRGRHRPGRGKRHDRFHAPDGDPPVRLEVA